MTLALFVITVDPASSLVETVQRSTVRKLFQLSDGHVALCAHSLVWWSLFTFLVVKQSTNTLAEWGQSGFTCSVLLLLSM